MPSPHRFRHFTKQAVFISFALGGLVGCDSGVQEIRIAAQDFRFDPSEIHLSAEKPIRLRIVNEGRQPHEFQSPLLSPGEVRVLNGIDPSHTLSSGSVRLDPGRSVTLSMQVPPGAYLFRCLVQGHGGMAGTLIVE